MEGTPAHPAVLKEIEKLRLGKRKGYQNQALVDSKRDTVEKRLGAMASLIGKVAFGTKLHEVRVARAVRSDPTVYKVWNVGGWVMFGARPISRRLTRYLLPTTFCFRFGTRHSLLAAHYSPLTTRNLLLTTHYSLLTTHYSRLAPHYLRPGVGSAEQCPAARGSAGGALQLREVRTAERADRGKRQDRTCRGKGLLLLLPLRRTDD